MMFGGTVGATPSELRMLAFALAASPRFRDVEILSNCKILDHNRHIQFSATTFSYRNSFAYIGFEGTDSSFTGWREDFEMSHTYPVYAQIYASNYFEHITRSTPKMIYLGGHSKGGNLAEYAGMRAPAVLRNRIERIFNHDGPGFKPNALTEQEKTFLRSSVDKTVPQGSIVGMLLDDPVEARIIHSSEIGIKQHNAFTWEVNADGTDFASYDKGLDPVAELTRASLCEWVALYDDRELSTIVDGMFSVIESSGSQDVSEFMDGGIKTVLSLLEAAATMSKHSRETLLDALGALSGIVSKNMAGYRAFRARRDR